MSEPFFGTSFWVVLLLRCTTCSKSLAHLVQNEFGERRWSSARLLRDRCACERRLPSTEEPRIVARIDREWKNGKWPTLIERGQPTRAPFQHYG